MAERARKFSVIDGAPIASIVAPECKPADPFDDYCDASGNLQFRPGVGYYRRAIRQAVTREDLEARALAAVFELEMLRRWVNETLGMIPPRWTAMREEADDKAGTTSELRR